MRVFIFIALRPLFKWSAYTPPANRSCLLSAEFYDHSSQAKQTARERTQAVCGGGRNVCHGTVLTDPGLMKIISRTREKGCIIYIYIYTPCLN